MEISKEQYKIMGIVIMGILLLLGSFITPILVYVNLVALWVLVILNLVRIGRKEPEEKGVVEEPAEEEPKQGLPDVAEAKKQYEKAAIEVEDYIKRNIKKGEKLEDIYGLLISNYGKEIVDPIIAKYLPPTPKKTEENPKEESAEQIEKDKEKTKKNKPKKKKIEIIDPPDIEEPKEKK